MFIIQLSEPERIMTPGASISTNLRPPEGVITDVDDASRGTASLGLELLRHQTRGLCGARLDGLSTRLKTKCKEYSVKLNSSFKVV